MKKIYLFLIILLAGTGQLLSQQLQNSDLLFVVGSDSEFSQAIASATGGDDNLKYVHVAILKVDNDMMQVIEADPENGVRKITLDEFLAGAPRLSGNPGVVIKRLNADFDADSAVANAEKHLGEPYDWLYLPDNGKSYCSELVYESYIDEQGHPIFQAVPMNFRNADGTMPEFWERLFRQSGMAVPEGVPGTNPQDMSKDSRLKEVLRYF